MSAKMQPETIYSHAAPYLKSVQDQARDDVPMASERPESADGDRDDPEPTGPSVKPTEKKEPRWQDQIAQDKKIRTVRFRTLLEETVTEEPNYIEPNFAGPGQFVVIAGPPKAQKSFLLQEMLVACATGGSFLMNTFKAPRPLRVFYLQAEMNRRLLRARARQFTDLTPGELEL